MTILAFVLNGCSRSNVVRESLSSVPENPLVVSIKHESTMFEIRSKFTGKRISPGLEIYSNGRVTVCDFDGNETEKRLQLRDVQALLRSLEQAGLFSLSPGDIESSIERENKLAPAIVDGSYVSISAWSGEKSVSLKRYCLSEEVKAYPGVKQLQVMTNCLAKVEAMVDEKSSEPLKLSGVDLNRLPQ